MNIHVNEIRNEYQKIDRDWLKLHYRITGGLVLFALIVEVVMAFIVVGTGFINTSLPRYFFKYLIFPTATNLFIFAVDSFVFYSKKIQQKYKILTISISMVLICFVLYTVHSYFAAAAFIFSVAILLTVIYTSFSVTYSTSILSILSLIVSELFIKWDSDKISIFQSPGRLGEFIVSVAVLLSFSFVCVIEIRYERKKNEASIMKEIERQHLKEKIHLDEITGLLNRKALHDVLNKIDTDGVDGEFIFAIADIDHFKKVNDEFGHHVGDHCLIEFARILNEHLEKTLVFRYGGDEFCLIFHKTDLEAAISTCEKIQNKLVQKDNPNNQTPHFTVSFGLAKYIKDMNSVQLFKNADKALYKAKKERNSIHIFKPE